MANITRFVRILAGLLPCIFLVLPNTAAAGRIEAIWDVVLHDQINVPTNTSEQISVPAQFQIRTVFEDYVSATEEYFPDFSLTYFGTPSSTLIDRPLAPYIVPSPYGPPIDDWSRLHVGMSTADDSSSFFENFNIQLYNLAQNDKGQWAHGMYISVTSESPVRNGDGTSDFHHTPGQLWDFLNELKESPSNSYAFFNEYFTIWEAGSASLTGGKRWSGSLQLASLQRLDASEIPEPAPFALLGIGFLTACLIARPRRAKTALSGT